MNGILLEFAGRMSDAGATQLPETFRQMAVNARFFLETRMAGSEFAKRLDEASDFRVNQKKGRIVWSFGDAPEVAADAQVIGTYSDDGSFMWGWGHPDVEEPMQQAAWAVQQFGDGAGHHVAWGEVTERVAEATLVPLLKELAK